MNKIFYSFVFACLILLVACDDDNENNEDPTPQAEKVEFIHNVVVGDNTYLKGIKDINVGSVDNANSFTHSKTANMVIQDDNFFVFEGEEDKIYKYLRTDEGIERVGSALILPPKSKVTSMYCLNDSKAYAALPGIGKVAVINTQDMTIEKQIDLSSYALGQENGDNNPEPMVPIARDGKLFVFLWQEIAAFYPNPGAHTVVIDMVTDTPEKMISDTRGTMLCGMPAGEAFIDEKGDIYVYSQGGFGYFPQYSDGFLRIKKGETDYDPDYFFSIKDKSINEITNNMADYVNQYVYLGNGEIIGYINVPGDASNPPDFVNDRTMQPCKINIYNQTIEKLDIPASTGWSGCITKAGSDNILFGMVTPEGMGYYQYNHKTQNYLGKVIETQGAPFRIFEFKE